MSLTDDALDYRRDQVNNHLYLLPQHMQGAIHRYIFKGIGPGSFFTAVLSNDLMEAVARADGMNKEALPAYAEFLYNYAPAQCFGSPQAVQTWINKGGLEGQPNEDEAE